MSYIGLTEEFLKHGRLLKKPDDYTWNTIITNTINNFSDTAKDRLINSHSLALGVRSYISLPLNINGTVVGALNINSFETNAFSSDELNLLKIVSKQIEASINNARQTAIIKDREIRFKNIFHYLNDAIIIHNTDGFIKDVNKKALEMFEYDKRELISSDLSYLYPFSSMKPWASCLKPCSRMDFQRTKSSFRRKTETLSLQKSMPVFLKQKEISSYRLS